MFVEFRLLVDLESRLEQSLVLECISDILIAHFETNFEAYVKYCSNQVRFFRIPER